MSLVRSFTKRARAHTRGEEAPRSCTVKYTPGTINRAKISLPTELLSTTNVHALNAPDIRKASSTSTDSLASDSDNDFSSIDRSFLGPDNSSTIDLSPATPITPFSDFGTGNDTKDFFSSKPLISTTPASEPTPAIPQRAPSHSKKAHVELSRQRSFKRSMSPPPTEIVIPTVSSPQKITTAAAAVERPTHHFARDLAKVDEVTESFSPSNTTLDEEEQEMMAKGLRKFTVDDYLAEITGLTGGIYEDSIVLNPWM